MEITLMRFYSVIFEHSYVYLLISLIMAGLGFGTVLLFFMKSSIQEKYFKWLVVLPLFTFLIILLSNYFNVSVLLSLFFTLIIFMYIGSGTTFLFKKTGVPIPLLYFIDLSGAALGSIMSILLLNSFGAVRSLFILIILLSASVWMLYGFFFQRNFRITILWIATTVLAVSLFFIDTNRLVLPSHNLQKDMIASLHKKESTARIIESRWSSFGRSDLVETDNDSFKTLYIDGAAGTKMLKLDSETIDENLKFYLKYDYIAGIPLNTLPKSRKEDALVIGSGGGIDVVALLANDFKKVTAVEINPDFIDIVRQYGDYNGNIYNNHPRVDVINMEGRSFLRNSKKKFDVILISLPLIKSARNYGSFALTENYLFTYDAFKEYRESLKNEGYLVIVTHNSTETYRIVTNAIKSFTVNGTTVQEAMNHMIVVGKDTMPAFVLKNTPFTPEETDKFHKNIIELKKLGRTIFIPNTEQHTMVVNWPEGKEVFENMLDRALYVLSTGKIDLDSFIGYHPSNISYISDNSPFFYNFSRSLPPEISWVFIISLFILLSFIPLYRRGIKNRSSEQRGGYMLSFGVLGFSFIVIEISILQKFLFFWGQNSLALAIVLSGFLFSAGIGSLVSNIVRKSRTMLRISLISIPIISILFYYAGGDLLMSLEGSLPVFKTLLSFLIIFPLFFSMGIPYPTLLKSVRDAGMADLFPWFIGMNSLTTLLGGAIAVIVAMFFGFHYLILAGGALYTVLLLKSPSTLRLNSEIQADSRQVVNFS
jgi:predicted membrane-bound spermidine synthase